MKERCTEDKTSESLVSQKKTSESHAHMKLVKFCGKFQYYSSEKKSPE